MVNIIINCEGRQTLEAQELLVCRLKYYLLKMDRALLNPLTSHEFSNSIFEALQL